MDPTFVSTDSSLDLNSNLQLWLDAADNTQVELTYSTDSLSSATASGTSGTNTITTSANVSANLSVGARIRLGAAGAVTTADTLGTDTYTITVISGTTITVSETLTTTYSGSTLSRGLVSQLSDKANSNHATQATESDMPLWLDSGFNNNGVLKFDGNDYFDTGLAAITGNNARSYFMTANQLQFAAGNFNHLLHSGTTGAGQSHGLLYKAVGHSLSNHYWGSYYNSGVSVTATSTILGLSYNGATENYYVDSTNVGSNNIVLNTGSNTNYRIMSRIGAAAEYGRGDIGDIMIYNADINGNSRNLLEQYQSARWGVALDPTTDSNSEAAEAMSATGYSVFAADYLERLSASADIVLQADTSITLDLKGDTLTLDDDRSITLQTTNGNISTDSAGTIVTNRTTTGGNISFTAGGSGDIVIDHALTLNAQNGGVTTFTAGDDLTINAELSGTDQMIFDITDDVTLNADIATTSSASNALVVSAGDDFINAAGSDALEATNSRWLLYSDAPTGNTRDGLLPSTSEFNKNYASNAPGTIAGTDNRFIYNTAIAPTLVYQVGNDTVEYGDAYSSTPTFTYSSGLLAGDSLANIGLSGSAAASTTYSAGDNAGVKSGVLSGTAGTLTNALGYGYSFLGGDLTVTKANLIATLLDDSPTRQAGQANPEFEISYSGFKLSDTAASLDIAPLATTFATIGSAAGSYDITLGGGSDANYTITYANPAGTLTVTPAPVTTLPGSVLNADRNAAQSAQSIVANFFEPLFTPKRFVRTKAPKQQNTEFSRDPSTQTNPQQPNTITKPTQLAKSSRTSQPVPYYPKLANVMPGGPPVRTEAAPRMTMFDGLVEVMPEVVAFFGLDRLSDEQFEKLGMAFMDDDDEDQ